MCSAVDDLLELPPYGLAPEVRNAALLAAMAGQIVHHTNHCPPYARWCRHQGFDPGRPLRALADVPFLPVGIFKRMLLSSIPETSAVRVLASSGTSGQVPSRVPLDNVTRNRQVKVLAKLLSYRLGGTRRPMLILDAPPASQSDGERELSARVAGMRGYLIAATEKVYALRREGDRLLLDRERIDAAVGRWTAAGTPFCLLAYTYVLYEDVVRPLFESGQRIALPATTFVMHFGGWKKLRQRAVTKAMLNASTAAVFELPVSSVIDIFGFTEQLGVIYPDDPQGIKRVPTYSEVLVRDPRTLELVPDGSVGLLEFICPLPHSYPGIAILLDDMGRIITGENRGDACSGAGFEIVGRAEHAEPRGCGDTLPPRTYEVAR